MRKGTASKVKMGLWREDRNIFVHYQQSYEKLKRAVLASLEPTLSAETMDEYAGLASNTMSMITEKKFTTQQMEQAVAAGFVQEFVRQHGHTLYTEHAGVR